MYQDANPVATSPLADARSIKAEMTPPKDVPFVEFGGGPPPWREVRPL